MSRPLFVWVEDGKLHRNPAFEDCNVDDAKVINRYKQLSDVPKRALADPCAKCKPLEDIELPEEAPDSGASTTLGTAETTELPDPANA